MPAMFEEVSTITAKGQTTIPRAVRQALGLAYGGRVAFRVDEAGVTVHRVEVEDADPVIDTFLDFLARDITSRPDRLATLSPALMQRLATLIEGVAVDLETPIEGDVDL